MESFFAKGGFNCLEGYGSQADRASDDAESSFQAWGRRRGFVVVRSIYVVALPVRFVVALLAMKDDLGAVTYPAAMTAFVSLCLVWSYRIKLGTDQCRMSPRAERLAIALVQSPFTFFGISTLCFTESIVTNTREEKWLRYLINFFFLLVVQGSCMFFNQLWQLLAILLLVNVPCFLLEASWADALDGEVIVRLLLGIALTAAIFLHQTRAARSLYFSRVAEQRARIEVEGQTRKAEAWRGAFRSLLDSVFDASCVCDRAGVVSCPTPHLDQLMLGPPAPKKSATLQARSLLEFAADDGEWTRFRSFLLSVSGTAGARRMQLSLRNEARSRFDVNISAIALSEVAGAEPQIFVGVEVIGSHPSAAPVEDGLLPDSSEQVRSFIDNFKQPAHHSHAPQSLVAPSDVTGLALPKAPASAPSVMVAAYADEELSGYRPCPAGDCLPPDALVWQENKPDPVPVSELEPGSRVLCLDHLFGGTKYAPVTKREQADASSSTWVQVALQDGTQLTMTSDHPVFPLLAGDSGSGLGPGVKGEVVRARDLQPLLHSLSVVKTEAIKVESVSILGSEQVKAGGKPLPSERVSISVVQPSRHSIFVRDPRSAHPTSVAVGCGRPELLAGVQPGRREASLAMREVQVKNTFLQFRTAPLLDEASSWCSDLELARPRRRRSTSAPPSVVHAAAAVRRDAASSGSNGSGASVYSSVLSRSSEGLTTVVVVGNGPAADRNVMLIEKTSDQHTTVRLSDALQCQQRGLASVGSLGHAEGWCVPCIMEGWYQKEGSTAEPCRMHSYCHRCHEAHSAEQVKAVRRSRRRQLRLTRAGAGTNSEPSCAGEGFDNDCVI